MWDLSKFNFLLASERLKFWHNGIGGLKPTRFLSYQSIAPSTILYFHLYFFRNDLFLLNKLWNKIFRMRLLIPLITCVSINAIEETILSGNETELSNLTVSQLQDNFVPENENDDESQLENISSNQSDDTDSQVRLKLKSYLFFVCNFNSNNYF